MNPPGLQTILAKLIALTQERDVSTLEHSLVEALAELIAPESSSNAVAAVNASALAASTDTAQDAAVWMYRATDLTKRLFTVVTSSRKSAKHDVVSTELGAALADCFETGTKGMYVEDATCLLLYPLKNSKQQTSAVIVLQAALESAQGDATSISGLDSSTGLPGSSACLNGQFDEAIMMLLQIYQNFTGLISDNERDSLTSLLNRKTFEQKINKVLARLIKNSQRKDDKFRQYCFLAIFDIDHFKRVNDEFGHLMGDEVLLLFSQLMTKCFRDQDLLFRFGGEEFLGVFECAGIEDIQLILERFREKVASFGFPQIGRITVSAGFVEVHAQDAPTQLIDRADLALYYAKNNGRNRVCQYEGLVAMGELQENTREGDIELF